MKTCLFLSLLALGLCAPTPTPAPPGSDRVNITFAPTRGFHVGPITLWLTSDCAATDYFYTTDGTPPARTSTLYNSSLGIWLNTTTVVCALGVDLVNGCSESAQQCHTYIFIDSLLEQPRTTTMPGWEAMNLPGGLPAPNFGMDPAVVAAGGVTLRGSLQDIPTISIALSPRNLRLVYEVSEFEFVTPIAGQKYPRASVEVIVAGADPLNATKGIFCGLTGHSDPETKRSFFLDLNKVYDPEVGSFDFPVIELFPRMGSSKKKLESVVLRSGHQENWGVTSTDVTFLRDPFYRVLQDEINPDGIASHTTFVHLYLNGQYWGLYNLAERPDDKFAASYMGGDNSEYFAVNGGKTFSEKQASDNPLKYTTLFTQVIQQNTYLPQLSFYVDVPRFFDYLLLSWYVGMNDWPTKNYWVMYNGLVVTSTYRYTRWIAWDGELSLGTACISASNCANPGAWIHPQFLRPGCPAASCTPQNNLELPALWFFTQQDLPAATVYRDKFVEEAYRLLVLKSALRTSEAQQTWREMAAFIRSSVWAESARWGDNTARTHAAWDASQQAVLALLENNEDRLLALLQQNGFYPTIVPPQFSKRGGSFDPPLLNLVVSNLNRVQVPVPVVITTTTTTQTVNGSNATNQNQINATDVLLLVNGTLCLHVCRTSDPVSLPCPIDPDGANDPRVSATSSLCKTGAGFSSTLAENVTLQLSVPTGDTTREFVISARIWLDGQWTPLVTNRLAVGQKLSEYLKITEIMYDSTFFNQFSPPISRGDTDYIELYNANPTTALDLSDVAFTSGIDFTFPVGFRLQPLSYVVLCDHRSEFNQVYNNTKFPPCQLQYQGNLASDFDSLVLEDASGELIYNLTYWSGADDPLWPAASEGQCITLRSPAASTNVTLAASWQLCTRLCPAGPTCGPGAPGSGTPGCVDSASVCFDCAALALGLGCCADRDCPTAGDVCVTPTCCTPQPITCFTQGLFCGSLWDGCRSQQCGECLDGNCTAGQCSCELDPTQPQSCEAAGLQCGGRRLNLTGINGLPCVTLSCPADCPSGFTCSGTTCSAGSSPTGDDSGPNPASKFSLFSYFQ